MNACLSCGGTTDEVLNLGDFYLADFVDPGQSRGERYPLRLMLCESCTLLQLGDIVPRNTVINERYGFFSGLNEQNQRDLKENADYARRHAPAFPREWLDIGCNDGTLLSYAPSGMVRWGCDPLLGFDNFREAAERNGVDNYDGGYFHPANYGHGQFDVITSTAMFYALDNPQNFTEGVRQVLHPRGVWVIQMNYAPDMIANNTVDNIIHEHVGYYSVRSLRDLMHRCGLEICDVTYSDVKGGCFRVAVHHRGWGQVHASVQAALDSELQAGIGSPVIWEDWGEQVRNVLAETSGLLARLADQGTPAYCMGAGNRGGTLVQLLNGDRALLKCAVERGEHKVGKMWTSAGIPIISEKDFYVAGPRHVLVSPWFFRDEFIERDKDYLAAGGTMIFPLPHFELVTK